MRGLAIALGLVIASSACASDGFFACVESSQCGVDGRCDDGTCSFPDDTCESGRRFGQHGKPDVAGQCVPLDAATTDATTGAEPPGSTSADPTTGADADTLALEDMGSSAGTTSADTTSSDPSTGEGDTGSTTAAEDTGVPAVEFFDDFERPDADAIGNGWSEKTEAAFELVDGHVLRTNATTGYPDNLVLRPREEIVGDIEIAIVFDALVADPIGNPQIHARVQPEDAGQQGSVTGYILFATNGATLAITRQQAGEFATYFEQPITTPLEIGATYRLRLAVVGSDPVVLDGYLEQTSGNGDWVPLTAIHVDDADPTRIGDPGLCGFSADTELEHFRYDDFSWVAL